MSAPDPVAHCKEMVLFARTPGCVGLSLDDAAAIDAVLAQLADTQRAADVWLRRADTAEAEAEHQTERAEQAERESELMRGQRDNAERATQFANQQWDHFRGKAEQAERERDEARAEVARLRAVADHAAASLCAARDVLAAEAREMGRLPEHRGYATTMTPAEHRAARAVADIDSIIVQISAALAPAPQPDAPVCPSCGSSADDDGYCDPCATRAVAAEDAENVPPVLCACGIHHGPDQPHAPQPPAQEPSK